MESLLCRFPLYSLPYFVSVGGFFVIIAVFVTFFAEISVRNYEQSLRKIVDECPPPWPAAALDRGKDYLIRTPSMSILSICVAYL